MLEAGDDSMEYPQLQIWREKEGSGSYQRVGYTDINYPSSSITDTYTVVEYSLATPLAFQEGDILGAYQPRRSDSDVVMQFQDRGLLVSYRYDGEDNPLETFAVDGAETDQTDYPLVGVETGKYKAVLLSCTVEYLYHRSCWLQQGIPVLGEHE